MKKRLSAALLLITVLSLASIANNNFPVYDTIVKRFFNLYSVKSLTQAEKLRFEKRPTGWYVSVIAAYSKKNISNEIFWSGESGKYQQLNLPAIVNGEKDVEEETAFLSEWSKKYYDNSPYYGYEGFNSDIIRDFGTKTNLNDNTLYSLARAYSNYASDLLSAHTDFSDPSLTYQLKEGKNALSEVQLSEYRKYRHEAIRRFEQLKKQSPKFETIIGNISVKADNEYMVAFLDLRLYQNETEAKKELKENLYDKFMIASAKNYLTTCAPNAILFTNGDNDTFPLLYVQTEYGFRPDVLVVNTSLLNLGNYVNAIRNGVESAPKLKLTLSEQDYLNSNRDYIYVFDSTMTYFEIPAAIKTITDGKNLFDNGSAKVHYLPTKHLKISPPSSKTNKLGTDSVKWELSGFYLLRSNIFLLDLIANNDWERPIYFASTIAPEAKIDIPAKYFRAEGFADHLVPADAIKTLQSSDDPINETAMYDNLMHKFLWDGTSSMVSAERLTGINYRIQFAQLTETLINEGKLDSAKKVLDRMFEIFPDNVLLFDATVLQPAQWYFQLNENKKATSIALKLIENIKNKKDNYSGIEVANDDLTPQIVERLRKVATLYKSSEILKELDKLDNKKLQKR